MRWKSWRLKYKIASTFMVLFLLIVIILGYVSYFLMVTDYKARTLGLINNSIEQMSKTVDVNIKDMERLSQAIFGDPVIQRIMRSPATGQDAIYDNNEIRYRLVQYTYPWSNIQGVYIFTEDDRLYNFSRGSSPPFGYTMKNEPWFHLANIESEPGVFYWPTGKESTSSRDPKLVFSLIRAINDITTGGKLGYLKIDIDIDMMSSIFDNTSAELPLRFWLLNQTGFVMYDSSKTLTGQLLPEQMLQQLQLPIERLAFNQNDYLFTRYDLRNDWKIIALAPYDKALAQTVKIRNTILLIGAASLILVGLISFLTATNILRPLSALIATMRRVETGDLKVRLLDTGETDELGRLSRVFNHMLSSVDDLIKRVYQSELREKEAQLQALQAQTNPHMLFNTLYTMKALSRQKGAYEVADMAESLGNMLRYSMQGWQRTVTLAEELEHIQNYVHIQSIRFGDRIHYRSMIDDSILHAEVVRLSIQPLVENAVIHGLEGRIDGGSIHISAQVIYQDDTFEAAIMEISVSDTGGGLPSQELEQLNLILMNSDRYESMPGSMSGTGLLSIQRRVRLLYGNDFGLHLKPAEPSGIEVSLRIPFIEKEWNQ
jgi:two-component system sensor histidine kinase YesM